MKLHYYAETDSLYVEFRSEPGAETSEVASGLMSTWMSTEMSWGSTSTMLPGSSNSLRRRRRHYPTADEGRRQRWPSRPASEVDRTGPHGSRGEDMAIPDHQSIIACPCFSWLRTTRTHRVQDAVDLLAQRLGVTDEERQELIPSGRDVEIYSNVAWARTYMKKAGLLEDPKRRRIPHH